jgi:hypothetical protein
MILLDWTRMGRGYCLAGAVFKEQRWHIVRPLLCRIREASIRNVGWSAYLLDGHARWEILELLGPEVAPPQPPHFEDLWVRAMRSRRCFAPAEQRRAILAATQPPLNVPLFGVNLSGTRTGAYLRPGMGQRSLVTLVVPGQQLRFEVSWRTGSSEPDARVELPLPDLGMRYLPVKDHHLLRKAEQAGNDLVQRQQIITASVRQMGDQVAVRLGLSRAFALRADEIGMCWLMADGFFSLSDPQS